MKKLILLFALPSLFLTACQEQNNEQANEPTETALMKVNVVQVQPATLTQTLLLGRRCLVCKLNRSMWKWAMWLKKTGFSHVGSEQCAIAVASK